MSKKQLITIGIVLLGLSFIFMRNRTIQTDGHDTSILRYSQNEINFDKGSSALEVTKEICKNIETNNVEVLKNFVTEVPDIYIQKSNELMQKYLKLDEEKYQKAIQVEKNTFTITPYPTSANKEELVYNAISILEPIQEQKSKFIEVVDFKQYENEAKAVVTFGNGQLINSKYEVLLIYVDDSWKTFRIAYESKWSATYAEKVQ